MKAVMEEKLNIGKYTVIRRIGRGGEGSVYLARDEELQRMVAVKMIRGQDEAIGEDNVDGDGRGCKACGNDKEEGAQIMREAECLQRLKHPMLPVVYDLLWDDGWYLVMEYIQGITLHEYIARNGYAGEAQACAWAEQLLDILGYLHTRKTPVIYRDLKPQNIIVCPDGGLRLVDFGAAYRRDFGVGAEAGMAVTPGYGAPEQFGRTGHGVCADERSDIYALGKVLYYMVTGADPAKPPYTSLSIRDYQPLLPERLERIIRRCIQEEPGERYQVVEEIRRDLDRCGGRRHRLRRRAFIRSIEKRVWLTEK